MDGIWNFAWSCDGETASISMVIELKPTAQHDEIYIWQIFQQAMRDLIEKVWGWDEQWQIRNFKEQWQKSDTSLILYHDRRVGYVQTEPGSEYTFINMLVLEAGYRSRGLGPKIIGAVERKAHGLPIKLKCLIANEAAYRFYLRNGFQLTEQDDVFYTLQSGGDARPRKGR